MGYDHFHLNSNLKEVKDVFIEEVEKCTLLNSNRDFKLKKLINK